MMGEQKSEPELFNYAVDLEKRVRSNHPLRKSKRWSILVLCARRWRTAMGRRGTSPWRITPFPNILICTKLLQIS
jgi:hypothetical protein